MKIILFAVFFSLFLIPSRAYSQAPDSLGVYSFVPEQPAFKGGDEALYKFINDNIQYPADALHEKKSGKILVRVVIDEEGEVNSIKAIRGVCPSLDSEAMRVISLTSGKWTSGKIAGKPVKAYKFIPVNFKIDTTTNEIVSQKVEFIGGDSAFLLFVKANVKIPRIIVEANLWADSRVAVTIDSSNQITSTIPGPGQKDLNKEAIRLIKLTQGKWYCSNKHSDLTKVVTIHFTKELISPDGKNIITMPNEDIIGIATDRDPAFSKAHDAYIQKDYPTALSLFQDCIDKNPDYRAARMMHAMILALMGRLENACDELNKLSHENVGGARIQKFYQAICLDKYEKKDPSHVMIIVSRLF